LIEGQTCQPPLVSSPFCPFCITTLLGDGRLQNGASSLHVLEKSLSTNTRRGTGMPYAFGGKLGVSKWEDLLNRPRLLKVQVYFIGFPPLSYFWGSDRGGLEPWPLPHPIV